jgi:hypothetical protein
VQAGEAKYFKFFVPRDAAAAQVSKLACLGARRSLRFSYSRNSHP